jgi:hypothetical protein
MDLINNFSLVFSGFLVNFGKSNYEAIFVFGFFDYELDFSSDPFSLIYF